jgi:hypothetical protein
MYSGTSWTGDYKKHIVPAKNDLSLTDSSVNYLIVDNSSETPVYAITTDSTQINGSNKILASTLWRETSSVHYVNVDWGLSTANRLNNRQIHVMRYERSSGLMLSESATKIINISSGVIWYGITANSKSEISSSSNNCVFYYHTSSNTWNKEIVSNWTNDYYDDGSARQTLHSNYHTVVWVYRFVNGDNLPDMAYILGDSYHKLADAKASAVPSSVPPILQRMAILVGRIIVQNGVSTAIEVNSAFTQVFAGSSVTSHNSLADLQGGIADQHYHLSQNEYQNTSSVYSTVQTNSSIWDSTIPSSGNFTSIQQTSTEFHYWGNPTINGCVRIGLSADYFATQILSGGIWYNKNLISLL